MNYKTVKLIDCCKSISDGDHMSPPKSKSGVPFITISNIDRDNQIDFEGAMFVPDCYYDGLSEEKKLVQEIFSIPLLVHLECLSI